MPLPARSWCNRDFSPTVLQSLRIVGKFYGKELQGDEATKVGILGFINDTHTATAEFLDAIMRDHLPLKLGQSGHWREW